METIHVGGRYANKGIIFIAAMGLDNAKHIVNADTAVMNKMFSVTVNDLDVFNDIKPQNKMRS